MVIEWEYDGNILSGNLLQFAIENGPFSSLIYLLKMVISIAMLVYQRVRWYGDGSKFETGPQMASSHTHMEIRQVTYHHMTGE